MLNPDFVKPQYGGHCFADLPQTIISLLTGRGRLALAPEHFGPLPQHYQTVIFFFIDAFGWQFFEKYADDYPFLQTIIEHGYYSKLTSQFPSTTAAHVTCIHTGMSVGQSGIYEWQYYEPKLDAMIAPLLYSFARDSKRETLGNTDIQPSAILPTQTIYHTLREYNIPAYAFQFGGYTPSTYTNTIFDGAHLTPYKTFIEALINLRDLLAQQSGPAYYFLYYGNIDSICHQYGPNSAHVEAEIDMFLTMMDRLFLSPMRDQLTDTLLILTADHGQVEVDPATTIYLNQIPASARIQDHLQTNQQGHLLVPAGSSRDMFLHVKETGLDETQALLAQALAGRADVCQVQHLIKQGYFGPTPVSECLLSRIGNLVILPYARESVWWYEKNAYEMKFRGHHGGLTAEEMEIPLLLYPFAR